MQKTSFIHELGTIVNNTNKKQVRNKKKLQESYIIRIDITILINQ